MTISVNYCNLCANQYTQNHLHPHIMETPSIPALYHVFTSQGERSLQSLLDTCILFEKSPDYLFITISASRTRVDALDEAYRDALQATTVTLRRSVRTKFHQLLDDLYALIKAFLDQEQRNHESSEWEVISSRVDLDLRKAILRYRNELNEVVDRLFSQKEEGRPVDLDESLRAHLLSFAERWSTEICIIPALKCRGSIIAHLPSLGYMSGHVTGSHVGVDITPTETISKLRESFAKMGAVGSHGFAGKDGEKMLFVNEGSIGRDLATGNIIRFEETDGTVALFESMLQTIRRGGGY